jgi:quinol monooxygenase YgiN
MRKFEISYYTSHLDVPFCYGLHIEIQKKQDAAAVVMELQYQGREDMKEEDLIQYGFSANDDITLDCKLPLLWWDYINNAYDNCEKAVLNEDEDTNLIISFTDNGEDRMEVPTNTDEWEILLQELQQAVLEVCARELPLQLTYRVCEEKNPPKDYLLTMKFENREVIVKHNEKEVKRSWEETRDMLELLYAQEIQYEKATEKAPAKRGEWLQDTDGGWYKLYKDILNSEEDEDALKEITGFFVKNQD